MTDSFAIGEIAYSTKFQRAVIITGPLELHTNQFRAHKAKALHSDGKPDRVYYCLCAPASLRKLAAPQPAKWQDIEMITRGWNPTRTVGL